LKALTALQPFARGQHSTSLIVWSVSIYPAHTEELRCRTKLCYFFHFSFVLQIFLCLDNARSHTVRRCSATSDWRSN